MSDHTERLKKLYALAIRGVGGEKEQAQKLLEKLMQKYGVSLAELDEEQIKDFDIEVHGEFERKLLRQVVYKITDAVGNTHDLIYTKSRRPCRTKMRVRCTEAQKIEIDFLFDFYKNLWKKEMDALLVAFIHKHKLFGDPNAGESHTISDKEFKKLQRMMAGLSDETPLAQIEGSKAKKQKAKRGNQ